MVPIVVVELVLVGSKTAVVLVELVGIDVLIIGFLEPLLLVIGRERCRIKETGMAGEVDTFRLPEVVLGRLPAVEIAQSVDPTKLEDSAIMGDHLLLIRQH